MSKSNGNGNAPAKRKCRGVKKNGEPCSAAAWANGYCIAHQPEEVRKAVGHKSATRDGSQKGPQTIPSMAKRIIEANASAVLYPYLRALGLTIKRHKPTGQIVIVPSPQARAKLYGTSKDGIVKMSDYDDLEAMMRAAERLMDRVYGKPRQALTIGGDADGDAVRIEVPSSNERAAEVAQILVASGAVQAPSSGNGSG